MALNIIVESNVPYLRGVLEPVARVSYLPPEQITAETMRDADALITRTRTRCDESLLKGSRCSFIASATIGLDHVDLPWCESAGITVRNAPGCNAPAVAQYVMASILTLKGTDLSGLTLGIVGVGNVGRIVDRWARSLGMKTMLCDPPRAEKEGAEGFCSMADIAERADIVTFHTPITRTGNHPTYHMCGAEWLATLKRKPVIINSARGAVVDNGALVEALRSGLVSHAVIDCWEGEPAISPELLQLASIATPHIAGYSAEGKARASHMAVKALTEHFGLPECTMQVPVPHDAPLEVTPDDILSTYSPTTDTDALRAAPQMFENLRNTYKLRHEPK